MINKEAFLETYTQYQEVGITKQMNYDKFSQLALIAHSASMEGSTLTEIECQLLFDENIPAKGKSEEEQQIATDLKNAYDYAFSHAAQNSSYTVDYLKELEKKVIEHTGQPRVTETGTREAGLGDFRNIDVMAGVGGCSYPSYTLIASAMSDLCTNINERRQALLHSQDIIAQYQHSFATCFLLESIHPWTEGNGRLARLVMNALQYEYGLTPNKIIRENKAEYINALLRSKNGNDLSIFTDFLFKQHQENMQIEIHKYLNDNILNPIENFIEPQRDSKEPQEKSDNEPQIRPNEPQTNQREPQGNNNEPQEDLIEVQILRSIADNNKITREELATLTGASLSTIKRRLKNMGHLVQYVGSGYSGHWELKTKS